MNAPVTAWQIGEQSAHKPLGKFGSKAVERVTIAPVRTRIIFPATPSTKGE